MGSRRREEEKEKGKEGRRDVEEVEGNVAGGVGIGEGGGENEGERLELMALTTHSHAVAQSLWLTGWPQASDFSC